MPWQHWSQFGFAIGSIDFRWLLKKLKETSLYNHYLLYHSELSKISRFNILYRCIGYWYPKLLSLLYISIVYLQWRCSARITHWPVQCCRQPWVTVQSSPPSWVRAPSGVYTYSHSQPATDQEHATTKGFVAGLEAGSPWQVQLIVPVTNRF